MSLAAVPSAPLARRTPEIDGRTPVDVLAVEFLYAAVWRSRRRSAQPVDRDALLQRVFPNGVPAREAVLKRANAWLEEAEKLASLN